MIYQTTTVYAKPQHDMHRPQHNMLEPYNKYGQTIIMYAQNKPLYG